MSLRTLGLVLLLGASEILGLVLGQCFYSLFLKTLPPLALSSFNQGTAHVAFILYGAIAGLAIFALAISAASFARFFPAKPQDEPETADSL